MSSNSDKGFGHAQWVTNPSPKPDPGSKPANGSLSEWVRKDLEYKESLPQEKYS